MGALPPPRLIPVMVPEEGAKSLSNRNFVHRKYSSIDRLGRDK
jgi:hypothetical protein